jgi:hypothetical protein
MKTNVDEGMLISYLYDELPVAERKEEEEYLGLHPETRQELERLRSVHRTLGLLADKEVIAPSYLVERSRDVRPLYQTGWFRVSFGIAASIALLMTAARLTGLEVNYGNSELRIAFGGAKQPEVSKQEELTASQVQQMINASLTHQAQSMQAGWEDMKIQMEASIRQNLGEGMRLSPAQLNSVSRQASLASQEQVNQFVATLQAENLKQMQDYLKLSSSEQNQYIEGLLVDFAKYLQEQRRQDFQLLQTRVSSLEQNNSLFRVETEQILGSLISNVSQSKNAN